MYFSAEHMCGEPTMAYSWVIKIRFRTSVSIEWGGYFACRESVNSVALRGKHKKNEVLSKFLQANQRALK